ncbi:MAG: EAL domain-containing protein [Epsilonproteobacteria bacterium]|nr:EAL domain-containing protein [Campylobacterota bacterium]
MKKYNNKNSIRQKLLSMMLIVSFIVAFVGYITFIFWYIYSQYDKKVELSKTVVKVLSQNVAKLILLDDVKEASDITTILHSYKDINYLVLYNKNKKIIYTYQKAEQKLPTLNTPNQKDVVINYDNLEIVQKANYQNTHLGYLVINIQMETVVEILIKDLPLLVITILMFLLLSYLLSSYYAKSFTYPLVNLIKFLETIKLQDLDKKQLLNDLKTDDEFSTLYDKINTMLIRINKANQEQKIASATFEIDNAMIITDDTFKILKINHAYTNIMHYTQDEVIGKLPPVLKSSLETAQFYDKLKETLKEDRYWSGDIKNSTKEGVVFYEHLSIYAVSDKNDIIEYYIFSFIDITKQKNIEAKLKFLQQYDSLTGLANKELAIQKIKEKQIYSSAILSFDIQNFKQVNEAYGYEIGDILLKEVAQMVEENFSNISVFSRLENNRFLLYLNYDKEDDIAFESNTDAEYLLSLFSKPFLIYEKTIYVNISIGVTLHTEKKSVLTLIDEVNTALEYAKKNNQPIYFFNKSMQNRAQEYMDLYTSLVEAIKKEEFKLHYQLQFDKDKKPYGVEALIRWYHPQKGIISPDVFIPLAEKTGLVSQIGKIVLVLACKQLQEWQDDLLAKDFMISVNIGSKHFMEDDFVEQVKNIVLEYQIKPTKIQLELTEYLLVDNPKKVANTMQQLKDLGFKISLDDFGTGYSSLQYLRELPLDEIKIDQTFVHNFLNNKKDEAVISAMLLLATALDVHIIAEGIEEEEQLQKLLKLQCYQFQGYLLSRPLEATKLLQKLHSV